MLTKPSSVIKSIIFNSNTTSDLSPIIPQYSNLIFVPKYIFHLPLTKQQTCFTFLMHTQEYVP